jgi:hypothetical protein
MVPPREVLLNQVALQVRAIGGQDVPRELLEETFNGLVDEED